MIGMLQAHYGRELQVFRPDPHAVAEHGAFAFYKSVDLRKACCGIRKVEHLRRMLAGWGVQLTGQRREQAVSRDELPKQEQDFVFGLYKFNPLALWTQEDVWTAIDGLGIP